MRRYIQWKVDRVGGQDWVSFDSSGANIVNWIADGIKAQNDQCILNVFII